MFLHSFLISLDDGRRAEYMRTSRYRFECRRATTETATSATNAPNYFARPLVPPATVFL